MGRFWSSSSSSTILEGAINNRMAYNDWTHTVPMGTAMQILWHFPLLRDKINYFLDRFKEWAQLLPEGHKSTRYNNANISYENIKKVVLGNMLVPDFINYYDINNTDERAIKVEALVAFLPNAYLLYEPIHCFFEDFETRRSYYDEIKNSKEEKDSATIRRYEEIDRLATEIRNFPIDNILDTQLLDA